MSIRELEKNKKYQIEIPIGYNGSKKIRHYETFYGGKKEAKIKEFQLKIQLKEGTYIKKTNMTFEDLSREYLKIQKEILSPKTYINYEHRMITINKHLGYIKLKDLNTKIIENFYNYMRRDYVSARGGKLSPTTIQHYYNIINNMLYRLLDGIIFLIIQMKELQSLKELNQIFSVIVLKKLINYLKLLNKNQ